MRHVEETMSMHKHTTTDPAGPGKKKAVSPQAGAKSEEDCRCKEVSEMSPRELLRTMFNDLAFWKKDKRD